MKKTLSLIIAVVMAVSMLTGCTQEQTPTTPSGTDGSTATTAPSTAAPTNEPTTEPTTEPVETEPIKTEPVETTEEPSTEPATEPTETQPAVTEHKHSYSSKTTKATCESKGYTTYTCSCGDSYKSDYTDATGHNYKTTTVEPTTSAKGYDLHECKNCGKSYKDNYTDKLSGDNDGSSNSSDGETGYYWGKESGAIGAPTVKIYHNCATQGHVVDDDKVVVIQKKDCTHYKVTQYTCKVIGCGAVWTETGTVMDSHTKSEEDKAKESMTDVINSYVIWCFDCHIHFYGKSSDADTAYALAKAQYDAHVAENGGDPSAHTISDEGYAYERSHPDTFVCTVCGQTCAWDDGI